MQYTLSKFITSLNKFPSFVTPIFTHQDKFYVQMIGQDGHIKDFGSFKLTKDHEELSIPCNKPESFQKGDNACYAFAWTKEDIISGTKHDLIRQLSENFDRLSDSPYVGLDVARFIASPELINTQIDIVSQKLSKSDPALAEEWRQFQRQRLFNADSLTDTGKDPFPTPAHREPVETPMDQSFRQAHNIKLDRKRASRSMVKTEWRNASKVLKTSAIFEKLTSRGALAFVLVCVELLFLFLLYAVSRDAEIMWSKDHVVRIIPQGSERIKQLQLQLNQSVSNDEYQRLKARYEQLEKEYQIASSRVSRLLAAAGVDLSGGEDMAVRKVEMLAARSNAADGDMSVSLSVIRLEVMKGGTINTNSRATDSARRGLFMDIQKFLRGVGMYNSEINGDQNTTSYAVKQFQQKYGLGADGIIGRSTLEAMEKAFEEAKSH